LAVVSLALAAYLFATKASFDFAILPHAVTQRYHSALVALVSIVTALAAVTSRGATSPPPQGWEPPPGHTQVPLWPGAVPDAQPVNGPESIAVHTGHLIAGKPWTTVQNVSRPTLTVFPPKATNTGAAVIVFPGGGYQELASDLEGTEVCEWLAAHGITGVLLKYRVPNSGHHWDSQLKRHVLPKAETALEDAQRTVGLVRYHAAEWKIDPHRIGVLGFSAGGHMVAAISTHWETRLYPAVDAADNQSCRPDFAVALYPGHLWSWTPKDNPNFDLNPDIASHVSSQTPPTFLVQAQDDRVDDVNDSLVYYIALKKAKVPVEMHLFAQGGHAFGLRHTEAPITDWPQLFEIWLKSLDAPHAVSAR
jgi:acetyl esterase/lipase